MRKIPGLWNGEDVGGQAQKTWLRVPQGLWGSRVQGSLGDTLNFFSSREWRAGNDSGQGMGVPRTEARLLVLWPSELELRVLVGKLRDTLFPTAVR